MFKISVADFKNLLLKDEFEEARKILTLKRSTFKQTEVITSNDLKGLPRDDFATFLIPEDVNRPRGQRFLALKATPNGDCLYNAISTLLCGNESAAISLRLLVAGELYFNAPFYADHDVFIDTSTSNPNLSLDTVFTVALTKAGPLSMSSRKEEAKPCRGH